MSYILEALKKLEEKRRSESEPYFLSAQHQERQKRKNNFPWRYLIVFGLFLSLGIFLWVLHPWHSGKDPETATMSVVRKTRVHGAHERGGESSADRPDSSGRQMQPVTKAEEHHPAGFGDVIPASPSQEPRAAFDEANRNTKTIGMNELPLSVRQKLPDLSISGHFYDGRPSVRVVTVGGRILHEGGAVAPGVTLERITPEGAVFSCDGLRFQKKVF